MAPQPFLKVATLTLDGNGNGQVTVAPGSQDWITAFITVSCTAPANGSLTQTPEVDHYLNAITDTNFLEGTFSGNKDTSDTKHIITQNDTFITVWTGGTPGAAASLRIQGWAFPPGQIDPSQV